MARHIGGIGQIQIKQDVGAVSVRRPVPRVEIETTEAELDIRSRKPQVSVDRTDYRDAVGALRIADPGNLIHRKAMQAIGQIAADGDQLARIENPGNTIAAVAQQEMPMDEVTLDLRSVPPPKVHSDPGGGESRGDARTREHSFSGYADPDRCEKGNGHGGHGSPADRQQNGLTAFDGQARKDF